MVDPKRAENELTNDGTTMRILAESLDKPSLWNRQPEVVRDSRSKGALQTAGAKAIEDEIKQTQLKASSRGEKGSIASESKTQSMFS